LILVTVGTQLPFDRLIEIVDEAAPNVAEPILAQTGRGQYVPRNIEWRPMIDPVEFADILSGVSLIVAHAGIGTLLMAQKHQKPVLVFPRRASLGEHRNEHQLATVKALQQRPGIYVAWTPEDVVHLLGQKLAPPTGLSVDYGKLKLIDKISSFIAEPGKKRDALASRRGLTGSREPS
jgi:UDP-N-acetylglucosamine transferase subunit ALG13